MVVLYLKQPHEASRTEVTVERIEGMAVQELTAVVAEKTKLDPEEMNVMYGGCVLRAGKTLDQYCIADGCTLHVLHKRKKERLISLPTTPEGMSVIFADPRVQEEITQFLNHPDLVTQMVPMGDRNKIQEILKDPELKTKMADMARISHYIHQNSLLFLVMEALLRLHRLKYSVRETEATPSIRASFLRQLVEETGLGGAEEFGGQDESERLATAQEQMFEHSQALHAQHRTHHHHPHQAHPTPPPSSHHRPPLPSSHHHHPSPSSSHHHRPPLPSSSSSASSQLHGSVQADTSSAQQSGLTPADLATALANIVTEHPSSQPSSQPPASQGSSSQPSFLQIPDMDFSAASAPASLQISEQPSPATAQPPPVYRSLSDSGRGNTGTGSAAVGSITPVSLQQALNVAMSSMQGQSSTSSSAVPPSRPRNQPLSLRDRYRAHLEQLHTMGITNNDAECLHALEAAEGDLQAALEILMGPGH